MRLRNISVKNYRMSLILQPGFTCFLFVAFKIWKIFQS